MAASGHFRRSFTIMVAYLSIKNVNTQFAQCQTLLERKTLHWNASFQEKPSRACFKLAEKELTDGPSVDCRRTGDDRELTEG